MSAGATVPPELVAHRRERVRLLVIDLAMLAASLGFAAWVVYAIVGQDRRDVFYVVPSLFATISGLSRYLVHRVRAVPAPVRALSHPDAATRERAWAIVDAHRAELLGATIVPATIHEPKLVALPREAVVERVARAGTRDWRKVLRVWLMVWVPLLILVFTLTLLYQPDPTHAY